MFTTLRRRTLAVRMVSLAGLALLAGAALVLAGVADQPSAPPDANGASNGGTNGAASPAALGTAMAPPGWPTGSPLAPPANGPRRPDPALHALLNATVHAKPGEKGVLATVLVRNGKIEAVLPAAEQPGEAENAAKDAAKPGEGAKAKVIDTPAGPVEATSWDYRGLHVYAAFVEPYLEVDAPTPGRDQPGVHWNGLVTPERDATQGAGVDAGTARGLRQVGYGAAAISPRGGIFRGRAAVVSLAEAPREASTPRIPVYAREVYQSVAFQEASGDREATGNWGGYPDSQMGCIAVIRQALADGEWWASQRQAGLVGGPPTALDALAPGGPRLLFNVTDELETLRAIKIAREFNRPAIVLTSGLEFRRLEAVAEAAGAGAIPLIVPLNFPRKPGVASLGEAEGLELRDLLTWEQAPANPRRLMARSPDLLVSFTTTKLRDRGGILEAVRTAMKHGLTEERALAALTTGPATLVGLGEQLGTVEAGKRASLIVADGPIFASKTKLRDVWVDGKRHEITPAPITYKGEWELTAPAIMDALGVKEPGPGEGAGAAELPRAKLELVMDEGNAVSVRFTPAKKPDEPKKGDDAKKPEEANKPADGAAKADDGKGEQPKKDEKAEEVKPAEVKATEVGVDGGKAEAGKGAAVGGRGGERRRGPGGAGGAGAGAGGASAGASGEKTARAKDVRVDGRRVSFVVDLHDLGVTGGGAVVVSGLAEGKDFAGELLLPSGARAVWSAKKTADEPKKAGDKAAAKADEKPAEKVDDKPGEKPAEGAAAASAGPVGSWTCTATGGPLPPEGIVVTLNITKAGDGYAMGIESPMGSMQAGGVSFDAAMGALRGTMNTPGGQGSLSLIIRGDELSGTVSMGPGVVNMAGTRKGGAGAGTAASDTAKAEKEELPDTSIGLWQVTLADDKPSPGPAGTPARVKIEKDNTVTLSAKLKPADEKPTEVKATEVSIDGRRVRYSVSMEAMGGTGAVKVDATRFGALLIGEMTTPSGAKVSVKMVRIGGVDFKGEPDGEMLAIGSIPERVGLPFGAYAYRQMPERPKAVLFEGFTVWTCEPGENEGVIANGSVLVEDGVIKAVSSGSIAAPAGAVVVKGNGRHLTPGIIDCHSHTGISKGVNESGRAVTAEVRIGDVTNPDAINWYRQLAGGVTAVNNLHGSANPIGGQNQVNKVRWGVTAPDDMHLGGAIAGIKFALGENVKQSNWGERFNTRYPQTRMGVETFIRDRFLAARDYAKAWEAWNAAGKSGPAPRRDLELEALAQILAGQRLVHCHSYRQDEILMLARVAQEFGFKIGTYQHILEGYKVAEAVRDAAIGGSAFSDWWAFKVEVQDAIPAAGPIMHEAGATVSYNSDSDELARRMHVEAAKAHKYSRLPDGTRTVSKAEALKFVTLNPAKQLKIEDRVGSIKVGKEADLAVWSGDPLSAFSRCEQTWVDGRPLFTIEQDGQLRLANAEHRQRITQRLLNAKGGGDGGGAVAEGRRPRRGGADAPARRPTDGDGVELAGAAGGIDGAAADWGASDLRSGRAPLMSRLRFEGFASRRELYLDLLRRGINPEDARRGVCGCFDER